VSPGSRAQRPLLQLVVVPRSAALQAAEDALGQALVALVLGTRPALAPADIVHHLRSHYGIPEERVTVRRTRPNDFLVRFADNDDLLRVLANQRPVGARFLLRWRRWSRLISGSAGAFRFRVLVGMKGIPAHAQSVEVAQAILGSAGAKVEFASPEALADPDDERELFAAAWCAHPDLVPDEVIMAVLEPEEPHDGGPNLFFLRPHEIIHDDVCDTWSEFAWSSFRTGILHQHQTTKTVSSEPARTMTTVMIAISMVFTPARGVAAGARDRVQPASPATATQGWDEGAAQGSWRGARGRQSGHSHALSRRRAVPARGPFPAGKLLTKGRVSTSASARKTQKSRAAARLILSKLLPTTPWWTRPLSARP